MSNKIVWETRQDKDLSCANKSIAFLKQEFQPAGIDDVWFDGYFQWKLGTVNPAGRGYLTEGIAEGEVIATISLAKKRMLLNGIEYTGAEFGDAYCSERFFNNLSSYIPKNTLPGQFPSTHYLNKSIFGRIAYETTQQAIADDVQILYGTPNQNALPSWVKRLGHFNFEEHNIYTFSKYSFRSFISRYRIFKKLDFLHKQIDSLIAYAVRLKLRGRANKKIDIEKAVPTEQEVTELWNLIKPSTGLSLVRDYHYWEHRYFKHPLAKYTLFKVKSGNETCGVFAVCIQKVSLDTSVCYLVEWMVAPGFSLDHILSEILFQLKDKHVDHFVTYCNLNSEDSLAFRNNFFTVGSKVNITFYETPLINAETLHNIPFHFFMGSTDAI